MPPHDAERLAVANEVRDAGVSDESELVSEGGDALSIRSQVHATRQRQRYG